MLVEKTFDVLTLFMVAPRTFNLKLCDLTRRVRALGTNVKLRLPVEACRNTLTFNCGVPIEMTCSLILRSENLASDNQNETVIPSERKILCAGSKMKEAAENGVNRDGIGAGSGR